MRSESFRKDVKMTVKNKNTSDIQQDPQTGLQTLDGFIERSRNVCITDEELIGIICDSLAGQNIRSFYNNGVISWRKDPVMLALKHFEKSSPAHSKYKKNELKFTEFMVEVNKTTQKALDDDPISVVPARILQNLACSSLCFVNDVYDGKENTR